MYTKIKNSLDNLNISFPIYNETFKSINFKTFDNENYKKGLKNSYKIYKFAKCDMLIFKIVFPINEFEICINILNKFMDIAKLKKPICLKKMIINDEEIAFFSWDLQHENINIKDLIKEILFIEDDGFKQLLNNVFFLNSSTNTMIYFSNNNLINIISNNEKFINKLNKKYKTLKFLDTMEE